MNFYKDYILKRENAEAIESEHGFITFSKDHDSWTICDYYIEPMARQKGYGKELADQVFEMARESGVNVIQCQSDMNASGFNIAHKVIMNYGFKPYDKIDSVILYFKEV